MLVFQLLLGLPTLLPISCFKVKKVVLASSGVTLSTTVTFSSTLLVRFSIHPSLSWLTSLSVHHLLRRRESTAHSLSNSNMSVRYRSLLHRSYGLGPQEVWMVLHPHFRYLWCRGHRCRCFTLHRTRRECYSHQAPRQALYRC